MDYTVIQPNYELRATSRQQLKGVWGSMALAFFVYFLIFSPYYVFSLIDEHDCSEGYIDPDEYSPVTTIFQSAMFITSGAFALGIAGYFLKRVRSEKIAIKNIFDGFKRFGSSLLLFFLTIIFVFLWTLLLLVPGIIKAFSYSMAFYILYDNPGMSAPEALKRSKIMMHGYKGKLLLLELSFIGWILLGMITLGIAWLWIYPYMYLSIANFYENLKRTQEKELLGTIPVENKSAETAEEEKLEIARKMKARGRPIEEIVEDTGLSPDIVENL
jgi:uncharacterized membrane protein